MEFTAEEKDQLLNPDIDKITIGRKNLKTIEIYPLSLADQLAMTEVIVSLAQSFLSMENVTDSDFVQVLIESAKGNFIDILKGITDSDDEEAKGLLNDITNKQAYEIGEKIYAMNYEFLKKSVKPWIEKLKQSRLAKSLQPVSEPTPSTISPTITDEASEMED